MEPNPSTSWLRERDRTAIVDVAVQPGAKNSELVGLHDGALRIRIAAPALDGRGNTALCAWLAEAVGCAKRDVDILRGASTRRKQVSIDADPGLVRRRLQALLDAALAAHPPR